MRKRTALAVLAAALSATAVAAPGAMAAGFRLPEAGAKAMGMGFAFGAQADDPSAIYYNPAGIAQLEGDHAMAGVTFVRENGGKFTGSTPLTGGGTVSETQKTLDFFIPNAYATHKGKGSGVAYGIGVFSPFGLGQEYEDRSTSIFRNQITKIDLRTIVLNPTIAYRFGNSVSVGAGIDYLYGWAKLDRTIISPGAPSPPLPPFGTTIGTSHLEGSGDAWGYNLGFLLTPETMPGVKMGLSYRSPFHFKVKDGDVTVNAPALLALPATSKAETTIEMPATAALGLAWQAGRLTLEADADWTFWSSFRSLDIRTKSGDPRLNSSTPKEWRDVVALRLGGDYRVTDPLAVRLGFSYDPSPVPGKTMGPELPDADRYYYTGGLGYKIGPVTVDAAYTYIQKKDRTVDNLNQNGAGTGFNGTWKGDAHLVALDLGYRF